jgi:hypothetical protein
MKFSFSAPVGVKGPGYNIAFIAGYGSIAWYIYMDK